MKAIGHTVWAIPEGYIPPESHGPGPAMTSHEAFCILNAGERDAHVAVTIFYEDRDPVGPYRLVVPAPHAALPLQRPGGARAHPKGHALL